MVGKLEYMEVIIMASLLYQGHGSYRITTDKKVVIYVDPYAGNEYEHPADLILVTHQHGDHNQVSMVTKKSDCIVIQNDDALYYGNYQSFMVKDVHIQAVPAYNKNHDRSQCVGYILTFDGRKLYASGDTSQTEEMKDIASMKLDYALLPIDSFYNMGPEEASVCADLIGAKHSIPIHMKPGALFDEQMAAKFIAKTRLIVRPGEELKL